MSTALPARAKVLRDRLMALDQLGANVEETSRLEDLRSDLAPPSDELSRSLDQRQLLMDSGIEAADPPSLDAARKRAAALLERFTAEPKAATLKRGSGWANLLREIKGASTDVTRSVVASWKEYGSRVFTGEAPAVVKGRLAFTPANNKAFSAYEQHYRAFRAEFDKPPADKAAIERVRTLVATLTETASQFDFNVPPDVKRFLDAIQSGGAKLDLLTDTVRNWLEETSASENYRIVPRSADGSR